MLALAAGLAVKCSASATAAFANIERHFITELRRLERFVVVQALALVARWRTAMRGRVVALRSADLSNTRWASAARTSASLHWFLNMRATAIAATTRTFHCHLYSP